jgi:hypothetical protein
MARGLSSGEPKKAWNLRLYTSLADGFDKAAKERFRADKALAVEAACLMFLSAKDEDRQKMVDAIKLAEGRGNDGTILVAALKILKSCRGE